VLKARGAAAIVGCDIDDAKLDAAQKLGARKTVNTRAPDALQQMQGVAAAIDFVGSPATAALGIAALRKGGRYVLCGLYGGELTHPLPPIAQRAIGIVGSYVGSLQELKEVVALAPRSAGSVALRSKLARRNRPNAALEDLKAGKVVGRIVLDFESVAAKRRKIRRSI
jgi:D-arabinose 1-dehydrogenase-like Zn-dependent alcohol dehydrogenase